MIYNPLGFWLTLVGTSTTKPMRNYSKIGCFLIFFFLFLEVSAQTSWPGGIFNPMLNNAGAVGVNEKIEVTYSLFENDFGFSSIGVHNFFAQMPINDKHSVGLLFSQRFDYVKLDGYQLFYSNKIQLSNWSLNIGANGGLQSRIAGFNEIFFDQRVNPYLDPIFEVSASNSIVLGTGLWLQNESWFVGLSTPNWINNQIYSRTFYGIAGYKFKVASFLGIQPTVDWNSDEIGHKFNFSTNLVIKDTFYIGGAINDTGEFSILSQVILWKYGRLGFSQRFEKDDYYYDSIGTAEIFLGVQFNRWRDGE